MGHLFQNQKETPNRDVLTPGGGGEEKKKKGTTMPVLTREKIHGCSPPWGIGSCASNLFKKKLGLLHGGRVRDKRRKKT